VDHFEVLAGSLPGEIFGWILAAGEAAVLPVPFCPTNTGSCSRHLEGIAAKGGHEDGIAGPDFDRYANSRLLAVRRQTEKRIGFCRNRLDKKNRSEI
jgi:hypothetical protein